MTGEINAPTFINGHPLTSAPSAIAHHRRHVDASRGRFLSPAGPALPPRFFGLPIPSTKALASLESRAVGGDCVSSALGAAASITLTMAARTILYVRVSKPVRVGWAEDEHSFGDTDSRLTHAVLRSTIVFLPLRHPETH